MTTKAAKSAAPRMSDAAVQAKTGKTWKEWFAILDKAGARKLSHQDIVKHLHEHEGVGPWWQQMVTVSYEQARGLRDPHQKPAGYEISVSRTINAPVAKVFRAFTVAKTRDAWLKEDELTIRGAIANKSLRLTWSDQKSSVVIAFVPKGDNKTQVVAQHAKLPNAKAAQKMKSYWGDALDRLRGSIE
jgi:uncharacterized protein YndB with AHSA1/START domain